MWPITKPKRITPLRAITILRPREDRRKACACAGVISRAPSCLTKSGGALTHHQGGRSRPPLKPPSHGAAAPQRRHALRATNPCSTCHRTVLHFIRARVPGANASGAGGGGEVPGGD